MTLRYGKQRLEANLTPFPTTPTFFFLKINGVQVGRALIGAFAMLVDHLQNLIVKRLLLLADG